jgi:phosphate:Na+ symporter
LTAAIILLLLDRCARLLENSPGSTARHVANAHTAFNVIKAVMVLPLAGLLSKLAILLVPAPSPGQKQAFGPRYLSDGPIEGGSLALGQSMREILRVSEIIRGMSDDWWRSFRNDLVPLAREVKERDDQVDLLDREIQKFLSRVGAENLDSDQAAEQMRQLRFLSELETVGDVVERSLCDLVIKKVKAAPVFSRESWRELDVFVRLIFENMLIAETAFHTRDPLLAQKLLRHKEAVNRCADELRDQHFGRLSRGLVESHETTAIYLDLVSSLRRINSHLSHVSYAILQNERPPSPFQQLLEKSKLDAEPPSTIGASVSVEHDR